MLAPYVIAAIAEAAKKCTDKRMLVVFGRPHELSELRAHASWQAPPPCFEQKRPIAIGVNEAFVVGSFDGVPVAEAEDAPDQAIAIVLDSAIVAGVSFLGDHGFAAWGASPNTPWRKTYPIAVDAGGLN